MVWPKFSSLELNSVIKLLEKGKVNYWTGEYGKKLEKDFSKLVNKKYGLCLTNATVALEYSLKILNLKKNDQVLVTPRSYYSSASCILKNNLVPVFCDVELNSQNISLESIKEKINSKTKALIVVHLGGNPAEIDKIKKFTKTNKILLIEDCSQAHGAKINNKLVGSFGDISIWSFCNDKIISAGEGGMVCLNDYTLYKKFWSNRDIGKDYNKFHKNMSSNYFFKWLHDDIGTNLRMTEMQSALAYYQLKNLKKTINKRKLIANNYIKIINNFKWLRVFKDNNKYSSARYRLNISINQDIVKNKFKAKAVIKDINNFKFICNEGPCPLIFEEKGFKNMNYKSSRLINCYKLKSNNISLIIDPTINIRDQKPLLIHLQKILENFSKKI